MLIFYKFLQNATFLGTSSKFYIKILKTLHKYEKITNYYKPLKIYDFFYNFLYFKKDKKHILEIFLNEITKKSTK